MQAAELPTAPTMKDDGEAPKAAPAAAAAPPPPDGYVRIEPRTFTMGTPSSEAGRDDDETQHIVTLTRAFFLKQTEVTQSQWRALMGNSPSRFSCDECPVEHVSWYDAVAYVNALSAKEGLTPCYTTANCTGTPGTSDYTCSSVTLTALTCRGYRLPTEAEWEYAARAGTTGSTYGGLDAIAWYEGNYDGSTHPVGQKSPNSFGLSDMIGNVWEWCHDGYGTYLGRAATEPTGVAGAADRVLRGGSWNYSARAARAGSRDRGRPDLRGGLLGFRPARSIP